MKNKYLWSGSIVGAVLVLDQVTKYLVLSSIHLYERITVIPGFFNLTHVRNKGAAFGLLADVPGIWRSLFFITTTLTALAVIGFLIRKTQDRLQVWAFSLIAAGAAGNLIDRIRFDEVVDFIQWYFRSFYWPSFNVADSAISVGVGLLILDMVLKKEPKEEGKS